jgi:nickel-dependent lactate racemase
MSNSIIQLPWGNQTLPMTLPSSWQLTGVLEPAPAEPAADIQREVARALAQPVVMPRLSSLMEAAAARTPSPRVVIVMDDGSRPTPVARILPKVLAELENCGQPRERITLVPALGLHRPMEADEIERRAGVAGLNYENPDCDDPQKLVSLGVTSRGTPVLINKTVAEADLVVSIGCIEPHIIASFGGGYKNIVPGVAGRETVAHNHTLNCAENTFNMVGQPVERNAMRLDLEEAAGMLAQQPHRPNLFIVNAILNHRQEIVQVVAGHPVEAHRAGIRTSGGMYGVQVPRPADVVITCSHPMNSDLRQGVKALANTIRAVKPGGVMITLVRAEEGVGVFGLARQKLPLGRGGLQVLAPLLVRLVPWMKVSGMGEEDRFFLYFALQAMRRARLLMYAPTIPAETRKGLPFVQFMDSTEAMLQFAQARFPRGAEVLVFPYGGITYPDFG